MPTINPVSWMAAAVIALILFLVATVGVFALSGRPTQVDMDNAVKRETDKTATANATLQAYQSKPALVSPAQSAAQPDNRPTSCDVALAGMKATLDEVRGHQRDRQIVRDVTRSQHTATPAPRATSAVPATVPVPQATPTVPTVGASPVAAGCGHRHNGVTIREFTGPSKSGATCASDRAEFAALFQAQCLSKNLGSLAADVACGKGIKFP